MRILRGQLICGVDALSLRRTFRRLRAFDSFSVEEFAEIVSLPTAQNVKVALRALIDEGYITQHAGAGRQNSFCRLTSKAGALALASAAKPLSRATADRLVDDFLTRAAAVNQNADLTYVVRDAVIFGSYITDARSLSDVDIGYRFARRSEESDLREDVRNRVGVARKGGRIFRSWLDEMSWPRTEVLLFLKSRSRGLSLHDMDDDAIFTGGLRTVAVIRSCQLVGRSPQMLEGRV